MDIKDLICIGLGPAACTTAIYTSRYKMDTVIIGSQPGGQVSVSTEIENYPGFLSIHGSELSKNLIDQVKHNGSEILFDNVVDINRSKNDLFEVKTNFSGNLYSKIVLLSTGMQHRKLGVKGEDDFYGKGVTYCATCDGMFYKNLDVLVVGGGNSAVESALYLSDICKSVKVFVRKNKFRAEQILVDKLLLKNNVEVLFETELLEICGEKKVDHVITKNNKKFNVQGVFIEIGSDPKNELAKKIGLNLDDEGYIVVDSKQQTSVKNILAAGDSTTGSDKFAQIATAIGEGAVAAKTAYNYFQYL